MPLLGSCGARLIVNRTELVKGTFVETTFVMMVLASGVKRVVSSTFVVVYGTVDTEKSKEWFSLRSGLEGHLSRLTVPVIVINGI